MSGCCKKSHPSSPLGAEDSKPLSQWKLKWRNLLVLCRIPRPSIEAGHTRFPDETRANVRFFWAPVFVLASLLRPWSCLQATLRQTISRRAGADSNDMLELLVRMYAHEVGRVACSPVPGWLHS